MAHIKKEDPITISEGISADVYTLRNNKGTAIKVLTYGARLISWRFLGKGYKFVDVLANSDVSDQSRGAVINSEKDLTKEIWEAEETYEGLKLVQLGSTVIYSLSNDNELSIKYESHTAALHNRLVFNTEILKDPKIKVFSDEFKGEHQALTSDYDFKWEIRDREAEVEMELGQFGYDPTCPIDYLDAGLKNAAEVFSSEAGLLLQVYETELPLHFSAVKSGLLIETGGMTQGQVVYVLKSR